MKTKSLPPFSFFFRWMKTKSSPSEQTQSLTWWVKVNWEHSERIWERASSSFLPTPVVLSKTEALVLTRETRRTHNFPESLTPSGWHLPCGTCPLAPIQWEKHSVGLESLLLSFVPAFRRVRSSHHFPSQRISKWTTMLFHSSPEHQLWGRGSSLLDMRRILHETDVHWS